MFSKFKIWRFVFFNSKTDAKPFSSFQNLTRHKFFQWKSEKTQNYQFKIWSVVKLKLQIKCVVFFDYNSDELHFPPIQNLTICKILGRQLARKKIFSSDSDALKTFQLKIWRVGSFQFKTCRVVMFLVQNVTCSRTLIHNHDFRKSREIVK